MIWLRAFNFVLICLMGCLCFACLPQVMYDPATSSPIEVQTQQVQQLSQVQQPAHTVQEHKDFQYYSTVYQQWIILGAYVLTTLIMAFYTSKKDKKKAQNVKKVADTLLIGRGSKPGVIFRLFRFFFKGPRK